MPRLILPREDLARLLRRRRSTGADRFDEVWDGTYVLSPLADNVHQAIASGLTAALLSLLGQDSGAVVLAGTNVTDRPERWRRNDRCPDVAVFLPGNPAEDRVTHWLGGPDLAVEVLSRGDRSRRKLDFYARVGVRELLLVDCHPWRLELHRPGGEGMTPVAALDPGAADAIESAILPVSFRLPAAEPRPRILVTHRDGRTWTV